MNGDNPVNFYRENDKDSSSLTSIIVVRLRNNSTARVVLADQIARNGILHVIDATLIPTYVMVNNTNTTF